MALLKSLWESGRVGHSGAMIQPNEPLDRPGVGSPRRLETLVDGTFAIVMTLIVLEIRIPRGPEDHLVHQLGDLVPTLLTYGLAFITLGTLWFGNRTQGEYVRRADHPFVWLTLMMLGLVALVPFSSGLLDAFPASRVAVAVFGVHLTVICLVHGSLWLYLSYRPHLMRKGVSEVYHRRSRLHAFLPAMGYAFSTVLGYALPLAGLIGYLLVPVPMVTGLFYRRLARLHEETGNATSG